MRWLCVLQARGFVALCPFSLDVGGVGICGGRALYNHEGSRRCFLLFWLSELVSKV
jgi:hypothetical protein